MQIKSALRTSGATPVIQLPIVQFFLIKVESSMHSMLNANQSIFILPLVFQTLVLFKGHSGMSEIEGMVRHNYGLLSL